MGLQSQPNRGPASAVRVERLDFEECRALLVFTLANGRTTGFPISWLYRFEHRAENREERFVMNFTEHTVIVSGQGLDALEARLKEGGGFHLKAMAERYASIQRNERAHIAGITIEAARPLLPEANN